MKHRSFLLVGLAILLATAAVAGPRLVRQTKPVYPAEAKQAGVTGTVVLDAMIAPDGAVRDVKVVSGPPMLVQAAVDAVSKWVYEPVTMDGAPVAARTKVTVNFGLPGSIAIEDTVSGANSLRPVDMPRPKYPPEAKAAGIQGPVRLRAVVGADGAVKTLNVMSGEPALAEAALEAVRSWKYEPVVIDGKPVEVMVDIDVNFTLSK
jgi:TonB family protein